MSQSTEAAAHYAPIAPTVPTGSKYIRQRWFHRGEILGRDVRSAGERGWESAAQVFRDGEKDIAELIVRSYSGSLALNVNLEFDPAGLRDLAFRLLDAAHDIETNPAAVLAKAAA